MTINFTHTSNALAQGEIDRDSEASEMELEFDENVVIPSNN